jgi:hypothetical protein
MNNSSIGDIFGGKMSTQDSLFLITELNEDDILKLFFEDSSVTILPLGQPNFVRKYVETDYYNVEAHRPDSWDVEHYHETYGFEPNMELYFDYMKTHFALGVLQAWSRIVQLLHKTEVDMLFTSNGSNELIRMDNRIKIRLDSG